MTNTSSYVVHLESRQDRLDALISQKIYNVFPNINIVHSFDSKEYSLSDFGDKVGLSTKFLIQNNKEASSHREILSFGAVSCSLGHHKALTQFLENTESDVGIILEDDFVINKNLNFDYKKYSNMLLDNTNNIDLIHLSKGTPSMSFIFGSHAYMVNKKGAQILVDNMFPVNYHYDAYINMLEELKLLNSIRTDDYFYQRPDGFGTSIHKGIQVKKQLTEKSSIILLIGLLTFILISFFTVGSNPYLIVFGLFVLFATIFTSFSVEAIYLAIIHYCSS